MGSFPHCPTYHPSPWCISRNRVDPDHYKHSPKPQYEQSNNPSVFSVAFILHNDQGWDLHGFKLLTSANRCCYFVIRMQNRTTTDRYNRRGEGKEKDKPVVASIDKNYAFGKNKIRVYSKGRSNNPNKVRICLHNTSGPKNKAFHFKSEKKPRYVTKRKGDLVCGEHPAGPNTTSWYMYRQNPIWKIVGTIDFNATGFAGQRVTFDWYDDWFSSVGLQSSTKTATQQNTKPDNSVIANTRVKKTHMHRVPTIT